MPNYMILKPLILKISSEDEIFKKIIFDKSFKD